MQFWLFKSEPASYSFERLEREKRTEWSGVRNYQARNFMKRMNVDDLGFFYHSSVVQPGIIGICRIVRTAYPDFTALDPQSDYFDPRATAEKPIWEMVDVAFKERLPRFLSLSTLKEVMILKDMQLLQKGQRLSIQTVTLQEWQAIIALGTC